MKVNEAQTSHDDRAKKAGEAPDSISGHAPLRFKVTYESGRGYFVSIPNYDGGDVVDAESYDKVVAALQTVTVNYETALRLLHQSAHTQKEQRHCSIVACWEGRSVISRARAVLEQTEKPCTSEHMGTSPKR